jgi:hypothetical protein
MISDSLRWLSRLLAKDECTSNSAAPTLLMLLLVFIYSVFIDNGPSIATISRVIFSEDDLVTR